MKKSFKLLYTVLFFLVCCLPALLMPFFKNDASIEKRELTEFPAYISEGKLNLQFSDQFESWFNDHLPLRSQLLSASNYLKGELMHAQTSNVIVGKEGWLFFASEAADYMDTNALTDSQVRAVAVTLSLIEEHVERAGGRFTFVPMPNKSSVYGEYMPAQYHGADENNLTRISDILREYGVNFTDMLSVLSGNKDRGLYHRRDSHWNYMGALIGYEAIMDSLGKGHPTYSNADYPTEKTWRGDLDKLLYPAGGVMDYQYSIDISHSKFVFIRPMGVGDAQAQLENFMSDREDHDDLFSTKNKELSDGSSLYMARDSFGRALLPFMIDSYETATFRRTDCPDLMNIPGGTDVVYEIAERNLSRVISTAPFMYAPERAGVSSSGLVDGGSLDPVVEATGYGVRIYGAFPEEAELGDGRVYIQLEREGERLVFEAFPIYESKLLEGEGTKGYSAILSNELELSGSYSLTVISGGKAYSCPNADI